MFVVHRCCYSCWSMVWEIEKRSDFWYMEQPYLDRKHSRIVDSCVLCGKGLVVILYISGNYNGIHRIYSISVLNRLARFNGTSR